MDQSKKTMRHFYCRDVLWETFEQMANDFDCSIDYLINESMRYYARSKNYPSISSGGIQPPNPQSGAHPQPQPPPAPYPAPGGPPPTPHTNQIRRQQAPGAPPPPPAGERRSSISSQPITQASQPVPQIAQQPAPQPSAAPPPPYREPVVGSTPTLYLIYNGHRYPISKDQFIIGRGSKTSDLAIKDGNISRKHAAVIRRNGTYYIKDLGSTNGIDYKGMRIDNKRVDEGDVFHICDYELRFTYRPD